MTSRKSSTPQDAVILAAGRGTRMKGLTEDVPKPMLPVAGRPLLAHILEALCSAGIRRHVIITGYHGEQIERHFGDGSRMGISIRYQRQVVRDGTARALLLAREDIDQRPFLLAWGAPCHCLPGASQVVPSSFPGRLGGIWERVGNDLEGKANGSGSGRETTATLNADRGASHRFRFTLS